MTRKAIASLGRASTLQRAETVRPLFFGKLRFQETFRLQKPRILRFVSYSVSHQMIDYAAFDPTFHVSQPQT